MKHATKPTWLVVLDSSTANFYELHRDEDDGLHIEPVAEAMTSDLHRHSRDLKSDKPGRGFRAGNSTARHGMEPPHDYHKLEKHDFVHAVAERLKAAQDAHKFEHLVLVAPDRSLGELRGQLADTVTKAVRHEIHKDLVKLNDTELWKHIGPEIRQSIAPQA